MQDRLHILEDLNMLYIRQMALSLEVMHHPTPPPSAPPMHASHPQSLPCSSLLGLRREGSPAQSGERDRWFCMPYIGCCVWTQAQYCQPEHILIAGSSHLLLEALWVGVVVCSVAESPFRYGKRGVQ